MGNEFLFIFTQHSQSRCCQLAMAHQSTTVALMTPKALPKNRRAFIRLLAATSLGAIAASYLSLKIRGTHYRGPLSDHFDGHAFFNPSGQTGNSFKNLFKWRRSRAPEPWPSTVSNRAQPALPQSLNPGECAVTFINHCTFLIQLHGLNVLTDPVFSERVSPVSWAGPKRIRPPGLAFDALPAIDLILISHSHYDHLDVPTLRRLQARFNPAIITGLGNANLLAQNGINGAESLDWWQRSRWNCAASVVFTPAQHWTSRSLIRRNATLWGGFFIQAQHGPSLYFAGDTAWFDGFRQIAAQLGSPDIAFLPIGAYKPEWFMQSSHISPADAVRAHQTLRAKQSIAMHFDTFPLADEAFGEAESALRSARDAAKLTSADFILPLTGQTLNFPA